MDKEVSHAVTLAVTLIALSVLITVVMYTVYIGNDLKENIVEQTVNIQTDISTGQLNSLAGGDPKIIPKATAYFILAKEYTGVKELQYQYVGNDGHIVGGLYVPNTHGYWAVDGNDLADEQYLMPADILDANNLDGKVSMYVERVGRGEFKITIEDVSLHE